MSIDLQIDLALVSAKKPLVALADVTIEIDDVRMTIRRCAVFEKEGRPPWASLPRIPIDKNGTRTCANLFDISTDLRRQILGKILEDFAAKQRAK
jgi:hypothetical protein